MAGGVFDASSESTAAKRLPQMLMQRVSLKLGELTSSAVSELKSYVRPPAAVGEVMRSAFLLLGKEESDLENWTQIKVMTGKTDLQLELAAVDPSVMAVETFPRWHKARRCARGLNVDFAWKKGSMASALIYEWMQHAFVANALFAKLHRGELCAKHATDEMRAEYSQLVAAQLREEQNDAIVVMQRHARGRMTRGLSKS